MKKITIEDMHRTAAERGGTCLSKKYINARSKLSWQCKDGHQWEATPTNIKSGTWCPACPPRNQGTIEEMQKLAQERGGKCLSKTYHFSSKLLWECRDGHQWHAIPAHIKNAGSWCPTCASKKCTIEEMQKLAQERGGECLSTTYTNAFTKLIWQCEQRHQWEAIPHNIKAGTWCPECAFSKPTTIEEMQKLAEERGGKCLSKTHKDRHSRMTWQCKRGHRWQARPTVIIRGEWCPTCAHRSF